MLERHANLLHGTPTPPTPTPIQRTCALSKRRQSTMRNHLLPPPSTAVAAGTAAVLPRITGRPAVAVAAHRPLRSSPSWSLLNRALTHQVGQGPFSIYSTFHLRPVACRPRSPLPIILLGKYRVIMSPAAEMNILQLYHSRLGRPTGI